MNEGSDRIGAGGSDSPVEEAGATPTATAHQDRAVAEWDSDPIQVPIPDFQYRYPDEIPEIHQEAIEAIRAEANRKIASKSAHSYEELVEARYAWVLEVAAGTALVLGRLAAREHWGANRRRDALRRFAIQAAYAAHLTYLVVQRFFRINPMERTGFPTVPSPTP
jgi:hypothetical protein